MYYYMVFVLKTRAVEMQKSARQVGMSLHKALIFVLLALLQLLPNIHTRPWMQTSETYMTAARKKKVMQEK